ncbi:asparagine--tRNA ligase [bacterium]|nr:asparagine--tRNA ligase [bacterium]
MDRIYITDLSQHEDQIVTLKGWLYNKRSSGKLRFLILRDGTATVQCVVFKGDVDEATFAAADALTQESSFEVTGKVVPDERAPSGYEMQVKSIKTVQIAMDYPITPKEHGTAFLMDNRHLWLRSSRQTAILKVRHTIIKACRDFFDDRGFTLVDTPIFTPAACEGTTTLFETDYFGEKAYLSQSGQLYSEAAIGALGKTYCFGPTFRAEKSKTRRHLTEFWMVEPEVAFADLDDNMKLAEEFVSFVVQRALENNQEELKRLERDTKPLENVVPPFPKITYDEAAKILLEQGVDFEYGSDFGGGDETVLADQFDRPVMIHRWPVEIKAFYMKHAPENDNLAMGVDVLAPEGYGEIIGGGQREEDYETLVSRIKAHGLPMEAFDWYLDLRKYGAVPHSGFGMGIERCVAWICKLPHVRETIPFPRMMARLKP